MIGTDGVTTMSLFSDVYKPVDCFFRRLAWTTQLAGMALLAALTGCAPETTAQKSYVKTCQLPSDQTGTLSGRWKAAPIPVALKSGDFSAEETAEMVAAADTWNSFYLSTQGFALLDYGTASSPNTTTATKPSALCSKGLVSGGKFTGEVAIYKQGTWPYSNHDAIALTSFCPSSADPIPNIYMAIMEVNYEDFFIDGKKLPDLESIFVHEFGHLIGLNHSCDTGGKSGFPDCNDSALDTEYYYASMFPIVLFDSRGIGENRRTLQTNDQGRANCLYDDYVDGAPTTD
ncbi:MAG: matrixin family metalloprotease [Bdellovibrionota bacterium]